MATPAAPIRQHGPVRPAALEPKVPSCRECRHFQNDAAALEAALPGLKSLGSAHAAVRAHDGMCSFHGRYVAASSLCSAATSTRQS
jgi:hypothetical protein